MTRRLGLFGAVLLALAVVYVTAWGTQPGPTHAAAQTAASRTVAVTAVDRSCPPPAPGSGQAHIAMVAMPSSGARATAAGQARGTASGTAQPARPTLSAVPAATTSGRQPSVKPVPVTASAPGALTTVSAPEAGSFGGTQIVATGPMAAGFEAEQATAGGLGMVACTHPGSDMWFVGTGQDAGASTIRLYLMNTGTMAASADVTILTDAGQQSGLNDGITVPPHQYVREDIAPLVRGSTALLLHVQTSTGQVAAAVWEGSGSTGAWLPQASAPATQVMIPGLTAASSAARLFIAVPGAGNANVKVTALTAQGKFLPFGSSPVNSPAAAASSFALSSLGASAAAIELSSNVPIAAAVLVPGNGIGSFTAAAAPVNEQGIAAGNPVGGGLTVGLVLSAPAGAVRASIAVVPSERQGHTPQGTSQLATVAAGHTVAVTVRPTHGDNQPFAIVVTPQAGSGPLYAARVVVSGGDGLSGPLTSVLPVPSALTTVTLPPTRDSYAAVLP
jgi:uncharacterized protein DUF5719